MEIIKKVIDAFFNINLIFEIKIQSLNIFYL